MKNKKIFSTLAIGFILSTSLFATGCSSKKVQSSGDTAAADVSSMQPTQIANAKLGKSSSGRAR